MSSVSSAANSSISRSTDQHALGLAVEIRMHLGHHIHQLGPLMFDDASSGHRHRGDAKGIGGTSVQRAGEYGPGGQCRRTLGSAALFPYGYSAARDNYLSTALGSRAIA